MSKPYVGVKVNAKEVEIAAKSIHAYRRQIKMIDEDKELLKNKKFHFGTCVIKKGSTQLEKMFGCAEGTVGKIVGYDRKYDYYRVYYSPENPYIGVKEEDLELYVGEIPKDVDMYNPYDIEIFTVRLK